MNTCWGLTSHDAPFYGASTQRDVHERTAQLKPIGVAVTICIFEAQSFAEAVARRKPRLESPPVCVSPFVVWLDRIPVWDVASVARVRTDRANPCSDHVAVRANQATVGTRSMQDQRRGCIVNKQHGRKMKTKTAQRENKGGVASGL